jgi:integrase
MDHRRSIAVSSFEAVRTALALDLEGRWASAAQVRRLVGLAERFERFCVDGFGLIGLDDVSPITARSFVTAADADGRPAGASLQRARRSAVRALYRCGRKVGLATTDPTADIRLPPLSALRARPLTDDEILECRAASTWSLTSDRRAVAWALAEATCRSGEIPNVLVCDVDNRTGALVIRGGGRCKSRQVQLTAWGREQVSFHLANDPDLSTPLVYAGGSPRLGGLVSANSAISQVLQRAGLADEPDVRPSSVVAWAGTKVLERTGRIEMVADALGLTSLDSAASFIGWNWARDLGAGDG